MPLDDHSLVVEPKFPNAEILASLGKARLTGQEQTTEENVRLRNSFWSRRHRMEILVWEEDGKIEWGPCSRPHGIDHALQTLGASVAWGIEQEAAALQTLAALLPHHSFKYYLLTGMFLESSERSGITYLFRKLRPTVALTLREEHVRIICALCLHPIAYYDGSWAGAMTPTDDVVAHLMLMRGDEPMLWRRSNQHPAWRPEAGL